MFYSHEGQLQQLQTPVRNIGADFQSTYVAQIWRCNCLVSPDITYLLLPHTDERGRLVAMLGAKSSMKRINRKQILDVDVEKACQTIVNPVAPMALRLQGNLLYAALLGENYTTLTYTQVRCVTCILAAMWICSRGRAKRANNYADDVTDSAECCARSGRRQG